MKKLSIFYILSLIICLGACTKDEPSNKDSSFTINGTKITNILYTLCETSTSSTKTMLEAHFKYDEQTYSLNMALPIRSLDEIEEGDKFDADDFYIYKFYPLSGAFVGHEDYEPISGKATVKSISNKALIMEYSCFKFLRELGSKEETFTINGTISYIVNNWK